MRRECVRVESSLGPRQLQLSSFFASLVSILKERGEGGRGSSKMLVMRSYIPADISPSGTYFSCVAPFSYIFYAQVHINAVHVRESASLFYPSFFILV